MAALKLKKCPYFGPATDDDESPGYDVPADYEADPFKYLPSEITLSEPELTLAEQYENGDFSGGYATSQIAYFRRAKPTQRHEDRRAKFERLRKTVDAEGLVLPPAFIELVETDSYINRLRNNTIWLQLPDEIVPLPADQAQKMFLIFGEGQGCGYWHLLLAPDGTHVVAYSGEPFGLNNIYPSGCEPDLANFEVYQCAETFCEWIVAYFADCQRDDRHYEELLKKYPGM